MAIRHHAAGGEYCGLGLMLLLGLSHWIASVAVVAPAHHPFSLTYASYFTPCPDHTHTHTQHKTAAFLFHSLLLFNFLTPFQQSSPLPCSHKSLPSPRSSPPFAPSLYSHLPKHLAEQLLSSSFCHFSPVLIFHI